MIALQVDRSYIPFIIISITFFWVFLRLFEKFKIFFDQSDLDFLNTRVVQYVLLSSLRLESFWNKDNYVINFLFGPFLIITTYLYITGIFTISSRTSSFSLEECLGVLVVLWVSLYFRLRMKYFNYIFLEVDGPTLSWTELLERLQNVHGLIIKNKLTADPVLELNSLAFTPYKEWRTNVSKAYQARGIHEAAGTAVKGLGLLLKSGSKSFLNAGVSICAVGVGAYWFKAQTELKVIAEDHRHTEALNRHTEEMEKLNLRHRELNIVEKAVESNKPIQYNIDLSKPNSYVDSQRNSKGHLDLVDPRVTKKGGFPGSNSNSVKKASFSEEDRPLVVRLDGTPVSVENVVYFFV